MNLTVNPKYKSLRSFISKVPDTFYDKSTGERLYWQRNQVKRYEIEGISCVVKSFKRPNIIQKLAYTFWRPSKAKRAFLFAHKLRSMQIDTPEEIAYIETFKYGLIDRSYFISLSTEDNNVSTGLYSGTTTSQNVETIDAQEAKNFNRPLAEALTSFLLEVQDKGVLHGDLNLTNILYRETEPKNYHFSFIDINRTTFVKNPDKETRLKNLVRITEPRVLFSFILRHYAQLKQWDPIATQTRGLELLDNFIAKRARKARLKGRTRKLVKKQS